MGLLQNGNLLNDGVWDHPWDTKNRLIAQEWSTNQPVVARLKLTGQVLV